MEFSSKWLSVCSTIVGLIGIVFSAYMFSVDKLSFEVMFWIMIGIVFFVIIMLYGDTRGDLKLIKLGQDNLDREFKLEQKKFDEKFKIYDRLIKLEEMVKNGN